MKKVLWVILLTLFGIHVGFSQDWQFQTDGNTDGWQPNTLSDKLHVENSLLTATSNHADGPKIRISGLNFLAINHTQLIIKLRNDAGVEGQEKTLRLFWNELSLERAVFHEYTATSGEFIILEIDLMSHSGWNGLITSLRLDLCYKGGKEVDIDYILFRESDSKLGLLTSYLISNKFSSQVLDVKQASFEAGAEVIMSQVNKALSQQWFLAADESSPHFYLKNINASKVLNNTAEGMVVSPIKGATVWKFTPNDEGYFRLNDSASGMFLGVSEGKPVLQDREASDNQLWKIEQTNPDYPVPEPIPINTGDYLVGAQSCNLWNAERNPWRAFQDYLNRRPVLDWYNEGTPIVTDWEIKMLVDHGFTFLMPCWYRKAGNEGKPVEATLEHWMKGLPQARYKDYIKYMLMWENANAISSGVQDEDDLLKNVIPYLIENYFSTDNYLKIDGKPILAIYGPSLLINELGGEAAAKAAFEKVDQMMIDAGFNGIILWGQFCWGSSLTTNSQIFNTGMEYTFPYHIPTFMQVLQGGLSPTSAQVIDGHFKAWDNQFKHSLVPNILTVSMGWDSSPWGNFVSARKWRLHPSKFEELSVHAKERMDSRPDDRLDSKIFLVDNWNEFGEGHYIMPTEQYGFGYLHAIKSVFAEQTVAAPAQQNLLSKTLVPYPNPATDYFLLKGFTDKPVLVELISLQGNIVFRKTIQNTDEKVDISSIPRGIYLVRVQGEVSKLVKK